MNPGLIVVISGPGGVGKDTLIEKLLARDPQLRYSVSYTTRPRRDYEVDGEHYSFVDEADFRRLLAEGELLEHATINGHLYGTSGSRLDQARADGHDVIVKIDVNGAEQMRPKRPEALYIFISPPSMEELLRRRIERGVETKREMTARQRLAEVEMGLADRYDHVIVNEDADTAVAVIEKILQRARRRRSEPAGTR
ncbi:MAG: guanylate kinase [Candidatus Nephthysia bennettiae]|uniref:Guanylate kinase n=1 Tax=Candidatus Nephthysia bennettiae TaxID=3127016 RepID=A0A934NFX6_9BACT|nr:guanylate kinase [Candidatus Dormibacteraeota bacterium]MBJ7611345.1 guanylate kinase [Candidatus Dormibacteraeota bacterium]PZR92716.1 MAG: guanylate kinase [Candidatus Dormibacteraeota bacterium]